MSQGYSSADRKQAAAAGQRGGSRKAALATIGAAVDAYDQGKAVSACMNDIKRALAALRTGQRAS